ncbi:Metallo-dependent phosphatase-like protein [Phycomyces nitens]|nr:Metallo-dependent phosphatase-like protein [Phycomyces nitens]
MRPNYILLASLASLILTHANPLQQIPFAATNTVQQQLDHATEEWLNADSTSSCNACISLLQMLKNLSFVSEKLMVSSLVNACVRTKKVHPDVCKGAIEEQAPILRQVLKTMDISGRDGHLMCAAVLNSCPYPAVEPYNVIFPKPKPQMALKKPSGKTFTVLQLSDWHIDPEYEAGSEVACDKPICCRSSSTDYNNITVPASKWGAYNCDAPYTLIESMLDFIPTIAPNIEFGILTGDVPPHEVWSTLPILKTRLIQDASFTMLHNHFDSPFHINTVLYPAVGNHEAAPTNIFPLKSSSLPKDPTKKYLDLEWLYKSLSKSWRGWLSYGTNVEVERNTANYAVRPMNGLKLISLNTNFCYTLNWWLYEHPMEKDPNGVLAWLVDQLQDAEDQNERVWIIGHVAPGDITCFHDYSNYYHQIIERYAPHVIAGQFFGHTHMDELQLFYRNNLKNASEAISVAYVAPSITPYEDINPGFRIYKIDSETFEVVDSITYVADLDQADTWVDGPNWHVEYSARQAYNSSFAPLNSALEPLSPAWWHNVTLAMESDPETFDKYWQYRSKSAPEVPECGEDCRASTICNIRAGKSELRCDYGQDVLFGKDQDTVEPKVYPQEHHICGLNLMSAKERKAHSL